MRSLLVRIFAASACLLATALPAIAQTDIPAALEPWRDWVLHGEEFRACPVLNGTEPGQQDNHVCAWPGVLAIDVDAGGAQFDLPWNVYAETWVTLPGNEQYWPADVTVDGAAQAVVNRAGAPSIRLAAGTHTVSGVLRWVTRPASVPVPAALALVRLVLDGTEVSNPELDRGGLWLGLREGDEREQDRLSIRVYRLLSDGIPIRLETRIRLDVAGQAREQTLDGALPAGFVGESLSSPLPAQLAPDGTLRVQLRPGSWVLRVQAHAETLIDSLTLADQVPPWPAEEIWSYSGDPQLRVTVLEGLTSVDGNQAGVPREWLELPAFAAVPGETARIVERSRIDAVEPNRLRLRRNLWLDFDGDAYTALDEVTGSMRSGWRLDMVAPWVMTMAESSGANLLVTEGLSPGLQGVEVRSTSPDLRMTSRLPAESALEVTGYAERFDRVDTTLHLPPAWRLFAAPGADAATGAWVGRWRLLDLFLVLIITVAAWRLFGARVGIVALAALVLVYHEPDAPRWAWLNVLLAIALARVAPAGRLRAFATRYKALSLALVALLLIPFLITQLRVVVYPQFERPFLSTLDGRAGAGIALPQVQQFRQPDAIRSEELRRASPESAAAADSGAIEEIAVTGSRIEPFTRYQPGALVQTGPGLPNWAWNRYSLSWSGPVEAGQTWRMVIFPPWLLQLWRVLGAAMALLFIGLLARPDLRLPAGLLRAGSAAAVAFMCLALIPRVTPAQATNDFPSPVLLEELRQRLTEPAPCHPSCAEFTSAGVDIGDMRMTVLLSVAAQDAVAVPLPVASEGWRPDAVRIDGIDRALLFRSRDGRHWAWVEPGVHTIELRGVLSPVDSFTLGFPLVPRAIEVDAAGWDVAGVLESRLPSGALELVRQRAAAGEGEEPLAATVFPPFVRVTRSVSFDLEWIVRTNVERVAPADGAFTLDVALLPEESVLTPGVEVEDGRVVAAFTAAQRAFGWESRLPLGEDLSLTAPSDMPWTESWVFSVSPMWHAEFDGFPASTHAMSGSSLFSPQYFPRPGESLAVTLTRPMAASGDTIAIDAVRYDRNVGDRSSESSVYFEYRSTQGGEHTILLPEGSELESVTIDDDVVPLELDDNRLVLQKTPGEHEVRVQWREIAGASFVSVLPRLDLGGGASNLYSQIVLPQDRWILHAYGPTLGPAILYWAELVIFVLAALVLGRLAFSPLRTYEWLLLGLGLSTFAWPVLLLFAFWAFALSWRGRADLDVGGRWFNAIQAGLAALTIVTIVTLVGSIPTGLLGAPNMQISSPVIDSGPLSWFSDRSEGLTARAGVISVSLWFYKAAMLAWALWLSFALLKWLRWAWAAYGHGGLWRGKLVKDG